MVSTRTSLRPVIAQDEFRTWLRKYDRVHIDLGTGDGTYALTLARRDPAMAVLGVDTCLDNLTKAARRSEPNLRFLACDATDAPTWLHNAATSVSINFPYGSLLRAVAEDIGRLLRIAAPGARIDVRINASAGTELGHPLEAIEERIARTMRVVAPRSASVSVLALDELRSFPTTWAKRLGYGRPTRVIVATALVGA
jgi:trans-aconitate methyltransferase